MNRALLFRWLGVAGIELTFDGHTLLVDPFFTRPRFLRMWFGRLEPNHALIAEKVKRCDGILVTHPHYDHLMDVPDVVRNTGATAFGSPHTCRLLEICGVPVQRIHRIAVGDRVELGPFQVQVLPAEHGFAPGFAPGPLAPGLGPPLKARDYRMDTCFSFLIGVGGQRLLDWGGSRAQQAPRANVLFMLPAAGEVMEAVLRSARPAVVIPIHWDDLFRPLSRPARPYFEPPRLAWPPLRRINLPALADTVRHVLPTALVIVPEAFRVYPLIPVDKP